MNEAAEKGHITLNFDVSTTGIKVPDGRILRDFEILTPLAKADVIIDLCKLKTHSLTRMSCATKNFFGSIAGVHKFEMHARFPAQPEFQNMLLDLSSYFAREKDLICICDAIIGMEGNGPTNGKPRKMGRLLASRSPYELDIAAEHLIGFDGTVEMCSRMAERGWVERKYENLEILGDLPEGPIEKWTLPDSQGKSLIETVPNLFGGRLSRFLSPKPVVNKKKCVGCGNCARSCPAHTIEVVQDGYRKRAKISPDKCIHCFCCQELCPYDAIDIKKNKIFSFIH
ncbi:MAG: DUF362 domain-containing protein, partial [Clostridia bacterium]|nr:DUF362 domain-containing protein [Clostridia bacterium]